MQSVAAFLATPEGRIALGSLPEEYLVADAAGEQQLPFLFKVLSVNKCLSIQAHPDKANAAVLHLRDPEHYGDDNHKPEMSVALTDFEAMCGFRPYGEIVAHCAAEGAYPEFSALLEGMVLPEASDAAAQRDAVRAVFTKYMDAELVEGGAFFRGLLDTMIERLAEKPAESLTALDTLLVRLSTQYPGDIGVFAPLVLNYVQLVKGDGIFLAANEPHAYLQGDIIECMACSNNVVRAGCTPKFKDVAELKRMLTYTCHRPVDLVERPAASEVEGGMLTYPAHTPEFVIKATPALAAAQPCTLAAAPSASIVLVTEGNGTFAAPAGGEAVAFSAGDVFLMAAGASYAIAGAAAGTQVFQVHFNH